MRNNLVKISLIMLLAVVLITAVIVMHSEFAKNVTTAEQSRSLFYQFIISGGPVVWFVLLPLSVITVYLAIEHSIAIRRKKLVPPGVSAKIIESVKMFGSDQLIQTLSNRSDFISAAILKAITGCGRDLFRIKNLAVESLQDDTLKLLRRIEWINLIGNVSPMVGLFGTVFGMIKLFNAIVTAGGQPQPAQLADGISTALVTTFWGLFIAIPALALHGVFRNRIESLANDAVVEIDELLPQITATLKQQQSLKNESLHKSRLPIKEIDTESKKPSDSFISSDK